MVGKAYTPPGRNERGMNLGASASLMLHLSGDGVLEQPQNMPVSVSTANRTTINSHPNNIKLTFAPATGLITDEACAGLPPACFCGRLN